jgi:hypothetical protein
VQPRAERPPPVEAIERAHRGEKRLLRDVLGCGGVVDDEQRGAVRARPVQPEELLEGANRAALRIAHERGFAPVDLGPTEDSRPHDCVGRELSDESHLHAVRSQVAPRSVHSKP